MRVRQDYRSQSGRVRPEGRPIERSRFLASLEQPAIDHHLGLPCFDQVTRPRDFAPCRAQNSDFHGGYFPRELQGISAAYSPAVPLEVGKLPGIRLTSSTTLRSHPKQVGLYSTALRC